MANIKQLQSRIESAQKKLAKAESMVETYQQRFDKALAEAISAGYDITIDNFVKSVNYGWAEYKIEGVEVDFELYCKLTNNLENRDNKQRDAEKLSQYIAGMEAEIKQQQDEAERKNREFNSGLAALLRDLLGNFKQAWFDRMHAYFRKFYQNAPARLARMEQAMKDARAAYDAMESGKHWNDEQSNRKNNAWNVFEKRRFEYNTFKADDVFKYDTEDAYIEFVDVQLEKDFEACIVKLTDKCKRFGIDESNLKAHGYNVTEKGFEAVLTDGKARRIYARMIWAAEYSQYMQPHTRYIVTERATI